MKMNYKPAAVIMTFLVWSLAGALFGGLFAALYGLLLLSELSPWLAVLLGTLIAAVTTTAFYSSMPLALAGSMAGVLGSVGSLMAEGTGVDLTLITGVAGAVGLVTGSLYAWLSQAGERPLAESLAGLVCGLVAGGLLALILALIGPILAMVAMAALIVAVVGGLFQITEKYLVSHIVRWCPHMVSAPVVAAVVAAVCACAGAPAASAQKARMACGRRDRRTMAAPGSDGRRYGLLALPPPAASDVSGQRALALGPDHGGYHAGGREKH